MCGLRHEAIQKRLLADKDLTFNIACDVAHAMELAARDTLELSGKPTTDTMDVHRLATARNQGNRFAETLQNGGQSPAQRKQPSNALYERQAASAQVVVSSMTPEHAHSEKQYAVAVTAPDTCIKCVVTPTQILSVKRAANSTATMHSESITLLSVDPETGTMCP